MTPLGQMVRRVVSPTPAHLAAPVPQGSTMTNLDPLASAVTRRAFLANGSLLLLGAGAGLSPAVALATDDPQRGRVGMVTDLHYADKPPARNRYYRETSTSWPTPVNSLGRTNQSSLSAWATSSIRPNR